MKNNWSRISSLTLLILASIAAQPLHAQNISQAQNTGPSGASILDYLQKKDEPASQAKAAEEGSTNLAVIYTNDLLKNVSGGLKRGTIDQGKVELQVAIDLEKALGFHDLTLYGNAFNIHNNGRIRRDYVGGLNTIAAIEARSATRLSELWLERKFLDGAASFRIGQLAADSEFFFADLSTMFLQSDYPTAAANNQTGGGPAYPLSTPGARLRFDLGPKRDTTLLFAIFNGDPAGPCAGDPDTCNRDGLRFRTKDPALIQGEAQFRWNQGKEDTGLARQVKLGVWTHLGRFDDQRFDANGVSLANPASTGVAIRHRGNSGVYGIIDQQLYRPAGGDAASGISVYARGSLNPDDRNLVSTYLDGGIVFNGLLPTRPNDKFGAAFIYARFSDRLRAFDRDQVSFGALSTPPRDYEANLELSYVAQVVPGWTIQPVFTYIAHPSGRGIRYPDAKVVGARFQFTF